VTAVRRRIGALVIGSAAAVWLAAGVEAQPAPAPRIAPLPESEWSTELRPVAAELASMGMPNLVASYARHPVLAQALLPHLRYGPEAADTGSVEQALLRATDELHGDDRISSETWAALAAALDTVELLDALIAVGAYRSTSMLINSAGVQLDANMADFRFPLELR
jgi:alkylhydroperoxidase family enzyme